MLFLCVVWLFVFFGQLFLSLNVGYEIWSCGKSISNKILPAEFKGTGIFFSFRAHQTTTAVISSLAQTVQCSVCLLTSFFE